MQLLNSPVGGGNPLPSYLQNRTQPPVLPGQPAKPSSPTVPQKPEIPGDTLSKLGGASVNPQPGSQPGQPSVMPVKQPTAPTKPSVMPSPPPAGAPQPGSAGQSAPAVKEPAAPALPATPLPQPGVNNPAQPGQGALPAGMHLDSNGVVTMDNFGGAGSGPVGSGVMSKYWDNATQSYKSAPLGQTMTPAMSAAAATGPNAAPPGYGWGGIGPDGKPVLMNTSTNTIVDPSQYAKLGLAGGTQATTPSAPPNLNMGMPGQPSPSDPNFMNWYKQNIGFGLDQPGTGINSVGPSLPTGGNSFAPPSPNDPNWLSRGGNPFSTPGGMNTTMGPGQNAPSPTNPVPFTGATPGSPVSPGANSPGASVLPVPPGAPSPSQISTLANASPSSSNLLAPPPNGSSSPVSFGNMGGLIEQEMGNPNPQNAPAMKQLFDAMTGQLQQEKTDELGQAGAAAAARGTFFGTPLQDATNPINQRFNLGVSNLAAQLAGQGAQNQLAGQQAAMGNAFNFLGQANTVNQQDFENTLAAANFGELNAYNPNMALYSMGAVPEPAMGASNPYGALGSLFANNGSGSNSAQYQQMIQALIKSMNG